MSTVISAIGGNGSTAARGDTIGHVYVHIPFCARICPYCAFYKDLLDRTQTDRFCQAISHELRRHLSGLSVVPATIYFGGGTPTALTSRQLELLLGGFADALDLSQLKEWTIEANPGSVSAGKAAILRKQGVNRISLGVQSWDDGLLKVLGREHNAAQAEQSFRTLRQAGFDNINIDLMFGLPGQTFDHWTETLNKTVALQPDHVSAYCLTYEEDTEFFRKQASGEFRSDNEADARFFEITASILGEAGYDQYETSNYARPGFESFHNRAYWTGQDYLGIGPSAFSTIGMQRLQNLCDYRAYTGRVLAGESAVDSIEPLTNEMKRVERIALCLRTKAGVSANLVHGRGAVLREFVALGFLRITDERLVLTPAGRLLADSVAAALI